MAKAEKEGDERSRNFFLFVENHNQADIEQGGNVLPGSKGMADQKGNVNNRVEMADEVGGKAWTQQ